MSSSVRLSSWKVKPPSLRTRPAMSWLAVTESGWPSDHIPARLGGAPGRGPEVDRVLAGGHRREQVPVRRADLHHVVEARVVAVVPLGEAEVGALAAVAGNDVADEHGAVVAGAPDH